MCVCVRACACVCVCVCACALQFGGSGLTALLPQPRLTRKLISKATPTDTPSSQDMVPYALSRHGRAAMAARRDLMKKTRKSKAAEKERNEDDSDSDDSEPVSFFSHLDTPSVAEHPAGGDEGVVSVLGREGEESVQAAPSAPKPFNIETMGVDQSTVDPSLVTRLWEESVGTSDDSLNVEGEREQPHLLSAYPSHMPGAGPGLSMDDQAVSQPSPSVSVGDQGASQPSPSVSMDDQGVSQPSPSVSMDDQGVSQPSPSVSMDDQGVSQPSPSVSMDDQGVSQPSPSVSMDDQGVSQPSPSVSVGDQGVSQPSPSVSMDDQGVSQPSPSVLVWMIRQ